MADISKISRLLDEYRLADLKKRSEDDLFVFCREVMGYSDMREQPHRKLCDFLMGKLPGQKDPNRKGIRKKLIMMPRDHFKSSIVMGYTCWSIKRNLNERILYDSEVLTNSIKFLGEMKMIAENNPVFRAVCGTWAGNVGWLHHEIRVNGRTSTKKEATIETSGLDSPKNSRHYTKIIADDLHSEGNSGTREAVDKVIDHIRYMDPLLDPLGSDLIVIGTHWSYIDAYTWIKDECFDEFEILSMGCYDENGDPIFPERYDREALENKRKALGSYKFSCLFMNQPIAKEDQKFDIEIIPKYDVLPDDLVNVLTVDPASSLKAESDFTTALVHGLSRSREMKWYWLDGIRDKLEGMDRINAVLELAEKWNVRLIIYEEFGFQKTDSSWMRLEMQKRGRLFSIMSVPHSKAAKIDRIMGLIPYYENGAVVWPRLGIIKRRKVDKVVYDLCREMENEMIMFPKGKHDDILDAQNMLREVDYRRYLNVPRSTPNVVDCSDYKVLIEQDRKRRFLSMKHGPKLLRG